MAEADNYSYSGPHQPAASVTASEPGPAVALTAEEEAEFRGVAEWADAEWGIHSDMRGRVSMYLLPVLASLDQARAERDQARRERDAVHSALLLVLSKLSLLRHRAHIDWGNPAIGPEYEYDQAIGQAERALQPAQEPTP
jgi:hypothetical protein